MERQEDGGTKENLKKRIFRRDKGRAPEKDTQGNRGKEQKKSWRSRIFRREKERAAEEDTHGKTRRWGGIKGESEEEDIQKRQRKSSRGKHPGKDKEMEGTREMLLRKISRREHPGREMGGTRDMLERRMIFRREKGELQRKTLREGQEDGKNKERAEEEDI
ncbi:octapeptide-repeat protein T2-like [Ranitomeya imitator]|uniref:octapeptide-repeat protein T2-like n=1 Tax=Ranitomeya imitator TaxID=111125 RepID=UPI0037E772B0